MSRWWERHLICYRRRWNEIVIVTLEPIHGYWNETENKKHITQNIK